MPGPAYHRAITRLASPNFAACGARAGAQAAAGVHSLFEEAASIWDARKNPIRFRGYSISYRNGHPHVRIEQAEYRRLKACFLDIAVRRSADSLERELGSLPFEPMRRCEGSSLRFLGQ